ncbi:MAG: alpha/beta hydrolase [Gammaproteobacteria bacterium]|nr:alpha/beta hydrolase [Gammaproteobacteria bacterium]
MTAVECAYEITGSGPAVFLVHGVGARKSAWNGVKTQLEKNFTCISYDLRGHGESAIGEMPYSLEVLIEDLERLREKLTFEKIHIAGHSLGGMIGPAYAKTYPQRTLSVTLLSTAAFRSKDDSAKVKGVVASMHEKGIEAILGTLTNRWFTDAFIANNLDKVDFRLKQVLATDAEVFLEVFRIYAETEMAPWLASVDKPCLVLTGENDGGCNPRLNRLIHSALPDSELVILENYKHSLLMEAPQEVGNRVCDFLLRHS